MKPQRLYEIFTEALADENIKAELIEIITGKADPDRIEGQTELFPEDDSSALAAENAALSRKIALLELEIGRLESHNTNLSSQIIRCKELLSVYNNAYAMQISLYEKYKSLSTKSLNVMSGIFKNNTLTGIFFCGVQIENLRSLRDYTEQLVINCYDTMKNDIRILDEMYTYFLSCYNSTFNKPVYRLTTYAKGDIYDDRLHLNIGTAKSGEIDSVLLQGCVCVNSGKIISKAVVTI